MYKISFDFPNLPKGGEIDIAGLHVENGDGVPQHMQNGHEYIVSDEMAEQFKVEHPVVLDEEGVRREAPGPDLVRAFHDNPYITVIEVGGDK